MIVDGLLQLSAAQTITAAAPSNNSIDLGQVPAYMDTPKCILLTVNQTVAAAGGATVQFQLQGADPSDPTFASAVVLLETDAIPKAKLVQGYQIYIRMPFIVGKQFLRVFYLVANGPLTSGVFTAQVVESEQAYSSYPVTNYN